MTDQRPIDVSTLRDGDIVRAKRGEHGVVEGRWSSNVGSWRIEDRRAGLDLARSHQGGWTITDIIRPVLVKGDRVEHVRGGDGIVEDVGSAGVFVRWSTGLQTMHEASDLTRLPTAPEPDPVCPFKPGDVVRYARDKQGHPQSFMDARRKVTNRLLTAGLWRVYYVYLDSGEAGYGRFQAGDSGWDWSDTLELAPEPAPIGDTYRDVLAAIREGGA